MSRQELIEGAVAVRGFLIDRLRAELVGPDPGPPAVQSGVFDSKVRGQEILRSQDAPRIRYGAGILFPTRSPVVEQQDDEAAETEEAGVDPGDVEVLGSASQAGSRAIDMLESETEQEVNRTNEFLPSAMGITALVRVPGRLRVTIRAGRYEREELEGWGQTDSDGNPRPYMGWRRIPIEQIVELSGEELLQEPVASFRRDVPLGPPRPILRLHIFSRPIPRFEHEPGARMITFTLLNDTERPGNRIHNEDCFFQCEFSVKDPEESSCFLEYPQTSAGSESRDSPSQDEESSLRLLYYHRRVFAIGHGCAPEWGAGQDEGALEIHTESVPLHEVAPILPTEMPELDLRMRTLSEPNCEAAIRTAEQLCSLYQTWIDKLRESIETPETIPPELGEVARRHISRAQNCLERMHGGIELLRSEPNVRAAFALANRAMTMQQLHYKKSSVEVREWIENDDGSGLVAASEYRQPTYESAPNRWYPFQFAFLLLNLRSMAQPDEEEREIVDIIWFPTGGGKTEAYLGLAAFTILLRRLNDRDDIGTTVLMRYTLRLLTTQQYQRAASMICALEWLRRRNEVDLGPTPITIGLWVGGGVTPNRESGTDDSAVAHLSRMQREGGGDNPFVLISCPWCGIRMGAIRTRQGYRIKGYRKLTNPPRVRHVCPDGDCEFNDDRGLPVLVVDESIYQSPPELVIGTVDKFALLPWYPQARSLFGLGGNMNSPPDLIIQDELHLISGPLGSMVGHYETVIQELCRPISGPPVKIIASTATIARAEEQVRSLYGREESFLFPPQGLWWGQSFFAREDTDLPGRAYVGVFTTGLPSQQTAMIRVLSSLLQAPLEVDSPTETLDPFWTLVAYFNSIRELGSAATLVSADIREYLSVVQNRQGITYRWDDAARERCRQLRVPVLELTSRVSRGQISEALDRLFSRYDGSQGSAVDVCLATNMIQVGLDVPRLGLMVVAGQPKMTSEYIQATSRVGRDLPGLIVTLYSPAKPRDRSHYEHFRTYHESIYRWVEPTSVTPFAIPVRERALHALVITLARYWGPDRVRDRPNPPPSEELLNRIVSVILERTSRVDEAELARTREELLKFTREWLRDPLSKYGSFAPPDAVIPMMYPYSMEPLQDWNGRGRPTPSSMRNVDAACDAAVIGSYPGRPEIPD